ncbi:MAG: hypothetical protein Q4P24_12630 [Rhodobacterales bacterium]|nr:hypothetical protein [Rhodobacterales bacterium]
MTEAAHGFTAELAEALGCVHGITVFLAQQLGSEVEMMQQLQAGTLGMVFLTVVKVLHPASGIRSLEQAETIAALALN